MTTSVFYCILLIVLVGLATPSQSQFILSTIEKTVSSQIHVSNISWQDLKYDLASSDSTRYIIFDTRSAAEYEVSHLSRAIQVDPQLPVVQFLNLYGDSLNNKNAVFYCSVGYRSSLFLQRVQKDLEKYGVLSASNLRGGIFRWYNENNLVVDAHGPTDKVHPYDKIWGGLLHERRKTH